MNINSFENVWNSFIVKFKGKLLSQSNNGNLNYSEVNLVFKDMVLSWSIKTDMEGKWLADYAFSNPEKGELIKKILAEDMTIKKIDKPKTPEFLKYIVPFVGAAAGLCISSVCDAGIAVKAISTIAPAVVLYPSANTVLNTLKIRNNENLIEEYISQLDKYKQSIISIISSN